ncbi:hypothetical protein PR048_010464 [Dryococelus australis]|uniref:Peptidase M48 domain-containing protein n=1 Tax=Dryococelus australis TaxID=614101 RepID=A0ABQ9I2R1_9NEOP|nr:hypothetical protein PR048_010464 [Dryococelus australis]
MLLQASQQQVTFLAAAAFHIKTKAKELAVDWSLLLLPLPWVGLHLTGLADDDFHLTLILWLCYVASFLLAVTCITTLFCRHEPLLLGGLHFKIVALAHGAHFPLHKLCILEEDFASSHKAWVSGLLGRETIFISPTLLNGDAGFTDDEVLAIVAHELAHWKLGHGTRKFVGVQGMGELCYSVCTIPVIVTAQHYALFQLNLLLMLAMFSWLFHEPALCGAFGFVGEQPFIIWLVIFQMYIFSTYSTVFRSVWMTLSQSKELQADLLSATLVEPQHLASALVKLSLRDLSFLPFDWSLSSCHLSHPTLLVRLQALDDYQRSHDYQHSHDISQ